VEWDKIINGKVEEPFVPDIQDVELDFGKYIEQDFLDQSISLIDSEAMLMQSDAYEKSNEDDVHR
jgi:hypothetical protein